MKYLSSKEIAAKWGISECMVCIYCDGGRVKNAYRDEDNSWRIPEDAKKPEKKKTEEIKVPKLLKKLIKQRDTGRYTGHYDYLQINMVYSNSRMASNRLTRE